MATVSGDPVIMEAVTKGSTVERAQEAARETKVVPMEVVPRVVSPAANSQREARAENVDTRKVGSLRMTRGLPTMRRVNRFTKDRWR